MIRILALAVICCSLAAAQEAPMKISPVPFTSVKFTDTFWAPRLELNRIVTIPHNFQMCQTTGRISNFDKAAGLAPGNHEGFFFNDSDVYKVLEGAAYSLAIHPDPALEKRCDEIISKIAAAQRDDGYIYTFYEIPNQIDKRFTSLKDHHELYCAGHLIEAAVAYYHATGKKNFLNVAMKLADFLDLTFGPEKKHEVDGHEEIELALFKLADATANPKYRKLAEFFLSIRGTDNGRQRWGPYFQDDVPVTEMQEVHGHAVRMMYLMCAVTDAAAAGNDADRRAAERLWENMVGKKMYITGGIGARHEGEAFGANYELPNESAYNETCAAIGNALWSHRMNLLEADAKYADVVEQVIYNGFLSGISLSGDKFFYVNPLASPGSHHRESWYPCACCPPNIVRFMPQIAGMVYATSDHNLFVNLYGSNEAVISKDIRIREESNYPWDGAIKIHIDSRGNRVSLHLRIPNWCKDASVSVNGRLVEDLRIERGYAVLPARTWNESSDVVELSLPMPIEWVKADPHVKDDDGLVALRRGPIVYCAEAVDNGGRVNNLVLLPDAPLHAELSNILGGVTIIKGKALARQQDGQPERSVDFQAVPYYAWDNRAPGEMAVWLAEDSAHAKPIPAPDSGTLESRGK